METVWPDDADTVSQARAAIGETVRARLKRNPMVSQIKDGAAEIYLRHGLISPQDCQRLIEIVDAGCVPSKLFSRTGGNDYRTSSSCNLNPHDRVVQALTARIDGLLGTQSDCGETLQGQRYQPGQEYKVHCDYFPGMAHYWPKMRDTGGQRCWTAMAYLCDVEEGGETHFVRLGLMVPPRRGTLLIWNNMRPDGMPNGETIHAALPVVRGTKYVLTKWYRERPWSPLTYTA